MGGAAATSASNARALCLAGLSKRPLTDVRDLSLDASIAAQHHYVDHCDGRSWLWLEMANAFTGHLAVPASNPLAPGSEICEVAP
jgi:hypothetical protein